MASSMWERYEKVKVIGKGSFGEAFLCHDKVDDREVVIKTMAGAVANEARAEIEFMRGLEHPHIVRLYGAEQEGEEVHIVMEYANGGDVAQLIKKRMGRTIPEQRVWTILTEVSLALKYLHDRKILHRDIKAANVFLHNGRVKLGDFGIAKALAATGHMAETKIGTPLYLSPELCNNEPYDAKSDMWALGCLVYELCALGHPFTAGSIQALAKKIRKGQVKRPIPDVYSDELRSLLHALLAVNPADRPDVGQVLASPSIQERIPNTFSEDEAAALGLSTTASDAPTASAPASAPVAIVVDPPAPALEPAKRRQDDPERAAALAAALESEGLTEVAPIPARLHLAMLRRFNVDLQEEAAPLASASATGLGSSTGLGSITGLGSMTGLGSITTGTVGTTAESDGGYSSSSDDGYSIREFSISQHDVGLAQIRRLAKERMGGSNGGSSKKKGKKKDKDKGQ